MKMIDIASVNKILIICLNGMGDVISTTPLIISVRRAFPNSKIFLLVKNGFMEKIFGNSRSVLVNKFFHLDPNKDALVSILKTISTLRKERIDLSFTATDTDFVKGPILTYMLGVACRVGETPAAPSFVNKIFGYDISTFANHNMHRVESNLDLYRTISADAAFGKTYFSLEDDRRIEKSDIFRSIKMENENCKYVVIHPGCNVIESFRRWPLVKYLIVAKYIAQQYKMLVYFVGGSDEADMSSEVDSSCNIYVRNFINKLQIEETALLIRGAKFIIGNDSGLMHIASAVETPTVSLIGYIDPIRCAPWGVHNEIVQPPNCLGKMSIRDITVDSVISSVDKILLAIKEN